MAWNSIFVFMSNAFHLMFTRWHMLRKGSMKNPTFGPWVQQFYQHDPKNVLGNWERFKGALKGHFEDPDPLSNQREKLLKLHTSGDLLDHITQFETPCAQIGWPDDTKASIFLTSLQLGLRRAIKRSDIEID